MQKLSFVKLGFTALVGLLNIKECVCVFTRAHIVCKEVWLDKEGPRFQGFVHLAVFVVPGHQDPPWLYVVVEAICGEAAVRLMKLLS